MSKYISLDWIGRDTIEVEKYVKDKSSLLAQNINSVTIGRGIKNSVKANDFSGLTQDQKTAVENIITSIIDMLSYSKVKEPIASITGIYYKQNLEVNKQTETEQSTGLRYRWPFRFLNVTYGEKAVSSVDTITNIPRFKQQIEIQIGYEQFISFLLEYMPSLNVLINREQQGLRAIYYMFILSVNRMLNNNSNGGFFTNFNRNTLVEDDSSQETFSAKAKTTTEYNFYIKEYENIFNKDFTSLQVLPNYYLLNTYLNTNEEQKVRDIISLNGRLKVTEQTVLSQDYYSDFSNTISNMTREQINDVVNKAKNYLIDVDYCNKSKLALSDEMLPYNNKILFTNDPSDPVSSFLNSNNLQTLFANNIYNIFGVSGSLTPLAGNINLYNDNVKGGYSSISYIKYTDAIKFNYTDKSSQIGFVFIPNQKQDFSLITKNTTPSVTGTLSLFTFMKLNALLLGIYENSFDLQSIFACTPNKSFSCGYMIDKSDQNNQNLYQTIVMARDNVVSDYEVIDTQVVYDGTVTYTISSMEMTINNRYSYTIFNNGLRNITDEERRTSIILETILQPEMSFYKVELYKKQATVIDNPPLPADVNIVPFVGVNNALRFLFNTQYGSYEEQPIAITDADQKFFTSIREKQKSNNKIYFETDDLITTIEVYRTTALPTSYTDFRNSLYRILDMKSLTANSFIDVVEPNQKYYYTFRSTDVHGNISNPSSVFEVQIVDDSGAIYPIIRTIPLLNKEIYDTTRSFRKYISITPSVTQTGFVPNQDNTQVTFGEAADLWGQKFKIRVTSKKTGKSFDLNVTFNKEEKSL